MGKDILKPLDIESNPLISAGAGAVLLCAFNAPFAGIIFVIEEMHDHFRFNFYSVVAIMISAGSSDFVFRTLVGSTSVIKMAVFSSPNILELLLFSFVEYLYNKLLILSLDFFQVSFKIPIIFVGLVIATIGIFFLEMIGGGYNTITEVLDLSFSLCFLLPLFIIRMLLSIYSYSTGVSGGIFAPMLTLGVILGMFFGIIMQHFFPDLISHPIIFAVAGMAGIFASTVRVPLTGLVLAVEMTSNFKLILPLIVSTVIASVFTALFGNKPIYTTLLKRHLVNTRSE
ncbi:MAG: chloride channel protein [Bacteroidales bacterium]|nr:chloride channel protein [Bacteroidales bacterium]